MVHSFSDGHVYATWAFPAWIATAGMLLCLVAAILAAVRARRGDKAWVIAILLIPVVGIFLLGAGMLPAWLAWLHGKQAALLEGAGPLTGRSFRGLLAWELMAWVGAVGLVSIGALARAMQGGVFTLERQAPALLAGIGGLLLALVGPAHAALLTWQGPLPHLTVDGPLRVHVGRAIDLSPKATAATQAADCTLRARVLEPTEPGPVELPLQAHCGLVSVERPVTVAVGEDRGDPALPLAPGHRWSWRHVREWHNQMLWFFPEKGRSEGPLLTLEVLERRHEGPLATWLLRESVEDGESTEHRVYAWDGALLWLDEEGLPTDTPFIARQAPADDGVAHGPDGEALVGCSFGLFPNCDCRCLLNPQGEATLPGPSICTPQRTLGDDVRAVGSLLLAAITAGTVWIDPDQQARWVLVSSETGPA